MSGNCCPSRCMLAITGRCRGSLLLQTTSSSLSELTHISLDADSSSHSSTIFNSAVNAMINMYFVVRFVLIRSSWIKHTNCGKNSLNKIQNNSTVLATYATWCNAGRAKSNHNVIGLIKTKTVNNRTHVR